jgi:hypothetical protein
MGCCTKMPLISDKKILLIEKVTDEIVSIFVLSSRFIREVIDMVWFDLKLSHHKMY